MINYQLRLYLSPFAKIWTNKLRIFGRTAGKGQPHLRWGEVVVLVTSCYVTPTMPISINTCFTCSFTPSPSTKTPYQIAFGAKPRGVEHFLRSPLGSVGRLVTGRAPGQGEGLTWSSSVQCLGDFDPSVHIWWKNCPAKILHPKIKNWLEGVLLSFFICSSRNCHSNSPQKIQKPFDFKAFLTPCHGISRIVGWHPQWLRTNIPAIVDPCPATLPRNHSWRREMAAPTCGQSAQCFQMYVQSISVHQKILISTPLPQHGLKHLFVKPHSQPKYKPQGSESKSQSRQHVLLELPGDVLVAAGSKRSLESSSWITQADIKVLTASNLKARPALPTAACSTALKRHAFKRQEAPLLLQPPETLHATNPLWEPREELQFRPGRSLQSPRLTSYHLVWKSGATGTSKNRNLAFPKNQQHG